MARNDQVAVPVRGTWVQLTDADVTSVTFKTIGAETMLLIGTVGAGTPPEPGDVTKAITCEPGRGEVAVPMSELFPGIAGANRLWATSDVATAGTRAFVSHA